MKNKWLGLGALLVCAVSFSGCTTLKGNVPFQYQPSLISTSKKIDKTVGINLIEDARSQDQIKSMDKAIKDVPNKVTYKIMEDLRVSSIFKEVNFPAKETDDIVINGKLNKFNWKVNTNFFALFTYLYIFGLPIEEHVGEVDITLELVDKHSGRVLAVVQGDDVEKVSYTMYNMSVGEFGSELAEAFRESVKEAKEKMISEIKF